jgi:hypothetical protein
MARGVIALLGSGETAPGMTKVHRRLLSRHDEIRAVNLDSPYGFQENVPQMTAKLVDYFATSLRTVLTPVSLTSYDDASEIERTIVRQQVRDANYVFAGPGSPSYALAQWRPLGITDEFERVLDAGGTLCFSSAAVVTLGRYAAPIYEIYKVGTAPFWLDGLDLLAVAGLSCVAVPHFDNAEGGNYDTRYCYLGERRLSLLESLLPDGVATLGIDEHTALILDLETDTAQVTGRGHAYWRHSGSTRVIDNGSSIELQELRNCPISPQRRDPVPVASDSDVVTLAGLIEVTGPQSTEALAQLVRRAQRSNEFGVDVTALIDGIVALRQRAKAENNFQLADELRALLTDSNIEVRDERDATIWRPLT